MSSSYMEEDDDAQFADLLHEFEQADGEADPQAFAEEGTVGAADDTDWEAIMAAADEAEASTPAFSAPLASMNMNKAAAPPKTFADMMAKVQPGFAAEATSTLLQPNPLNKRVTAIPTPTPTVHIPKKPIVASTPAPSTPTYSSAANLLNGPRPLTAPPSSTPTTITPSPASSQSSVSMSQKGVMFGSSAPVAAPAPSPYIQEPNADLRDKLSGFKITNRILSSTTLKEKLEGSKTLSIAEMLRRASSTPRPAPSSSSSNGSFHQSGGAGGGASFGIIGNFVLFGVLTHKSLPKDTSTGKGKFVVWTLSDLEGSSATLLLFGKAFEAYWKINEGAVVAVANPEDSSSFGSGRSSSGPTAGKPSVCLSLKFSGQLLEVGQCSDFGYCKSFRNEVGSHGRVKTMNKCRNVINTAKSEYCEYHIKSEFKKIMNKRPDTNQSRDMNQLPFAAPNAPSTLYHNAINNKIGAVNQMSGILQAKEKKQAKASKLMAGIMASASAARENRTVAAGMASTANPTQLKGRALLNARETPVSEKQKQEQEAKWAALSSNVRGGSRFVQRVSATQAGMAIAGSAVLTNNEMAHLVQVKQEEDTQARVKAELAAKLKKLEPPAPVDPKTALKNFSYVAKNPLPAATTPNPAFVNATNSATTSTTPAKPPSNAAVVTPASSSHLSARTASPATPSGPLAAMQAMQAAAAAGGGKPSTANTSAAKPPSASSTPSAAKAAPASSVPANAAAKTPVVTPAKPAAAPSSTPSALSSLIPDNALPFTKPQPSPAAFLKSFAAPAATNAPLSKQFGSGLVPMLGRGWESGSAPAAAAAAAATGGGLQLSVRDQKVREAQIRMVAEMRTAGLLEKPDPNSSNRTPLAMLQQYSNRFNKNETVAGMKRKLDEMASKPQDQVTVTADGKVVVIPAARTSSVDGMDTDDHHDRLTDEEHLAAAKRSRLAAAFGQTAALKKDSAALEQILSAKSKHADLVQQSDSSKQAEEALFNLMEKKESMAVQLNSIQQQTVKAYKCLEKGCTAELSEFPLALCKVKGNKFTKVDVQKRYFSCHQCKFHLSTLSSKMPTHACHKCGGTVWVKASMIPMKIDSSDRDQLVLRSEETFLRGAF